jgi:phenylalanyl-tRNA synthetase beta chain
VTLLHPGRSAEIFIGETKLGFLGEIHPLLEDEWGLERPVVFELDFDILAKHSSENIIARSYARFPAMQRDLAVIVSDEVPAEDIKNRIVEMGGELLNKVEIFDVYKGNQVTAGSKSLAFALKYQSQDRTLTDEEVSKLNFAILEAIQMEFGAEWRK